MGYDENVLYERLEEKALVIAQLEAENQRFREVLVWQMCDDHRTGTRNWSDDCESPHLTTSAVCKEMRRAILATYSAGGE